MAKQRRGEELVMMAIANRNAVNADQKQFAKFMKEIENGSE